MCLTDEVVGLHNVKKKHAQHKVKGTENVTRQVEIDKKRLETNESGWFARD